MHRLIFTPAKRLADINLASFDLGPYTIVPGFLPGDYNNICYAIQRDGNTVGRQMSRPNLDDCKNREREGITPVKAVFSRDRFNNVAVRICKTCYATRSLRQFRRDAQHCNQCVAAGLVRQI